MAYAKEPTPNKYVKQYKTTEIPIYLNTSDSGETMDYAPIEREDYRYKPWPREEIDELVAKKNKLFHKEREQEEMPDASILRIFPNTSFVGVTLSPQSPLKELWLAVAGQEGFEGIQETCPWDTGYKHPGGMFFNDKYFMQRDHDWSMNPPNSDWIKWDKPSCPCQGRGWIVNQDFDALLEAIRRNGREYNLWSLDGGDSVVIHVPRCQRLGSVQSTEGLRGIRAFLVAILRELGLMEVAE